MNKYAGDTCDGERVDQRRDSLREVAGDLSADPEVAFLLGY